jgi:hypothetical protein
VDPGNGQLAAALRCWSKNSDDDFQTVLAGGPPKIMELLLLSPPSFPAEPSSYSPTSSSALTTSGRFGSSGSTRDAMAARIQAMARGALTRLELQAGVGLARNAAQRLRARAGVLVGGRYPVLLQAAADWLGRVTFIDITGASLSALLIELNDLHILVMYV